MNRRPAAVADTATAGAGLPRGVLPAAGALTAVAFAAVTAGLVQPPDLEAALTDLSDTLGPWTYVLVAALAFLETGAFVGLIAPGETAIVLGGVVAAQGDVWHSTCAAPCPTTTQRRVPPQPRHAPDDRARQRRHGRPARAVNEIISQRLMRRRC
jgi:hypothetical protein